MAEQGDDSGSARLMFFSPQTGRQRTGAGDGPRTRPREHASCMVIKRDGKTQVPFDWRKLINAVTRQLWNLDPIVSPDRVIRSTHLSDLCTTAEITEETARVAASLVTEHPDYSVLGGRLLMRSLHKGVPKRFSDAMVAINEYRNPKIPQEQARVAGQGNLQPRVLDFIDKYKTELDAAVQPQRDYAFDYFACQTLLQSYLLRHETPGGKVVVETPQFMYMRVAVALYAFAPKEENDGLASVLQAYDDMSRGIISHASPTLFQAGTRNEQLASCFLLTMQPGLLDPTDRSGDSIDSFFHTLFHVAKISQGAGGIGASISTVRAKGAPIAGTGGVSNGIVPLLRTFQATAKYVDQGGNKRPGAVALYLAPWHADIFDFLDLRKNNGTEELRCRDLHQGLWVPDLFMERVRDDGPWTLMCPSMCPGLEDVWGSDFVRLYEQYEREGRGRRTIKARDLWRAILEAQCETGEPYMLYKDACNRKSNQQHLGTIKSSNLCVGRDTTVLTADGPETVAALHARCHEPVTAFDQMLKTRAAKRAEHDALTPRIAELSAVFTAATGRAPEYTDRGLLTAAVCKRYQASDVSAQLYGELVALTAQRAQLGPYPRMEADPVRDPTKHVPLTVRVWNGRAFRPVTVHQTGERKRLLRITTSYGSRIDCTPEHEFILEDGSRVPAQDLRLGSRLVAPALAVYPGVADVADNAAFLRGFVYARLIVSEGTKRERRLAQAPRLRLEVIEVVREKVKPQELVLLGYDEKFARKTLRDPRFKHDSVAYVSLMAAESDSDELKRKREQDQLGAVPLTGKERARRLWVAGFLAGLSRTLTAARGPFPMLEPAWMMLRSLGYDARLVPIWEDSDGLWQLQWPASFRAISNDEAAAILCPAGAADAAAGASSAHSAHSADSAHSAPEADKTYSAHSADSAAEVESAAEPDGAAADPITVAADTILAQIQRLPRVGPDAPVVTGMQNVGGVHTTYCFTEEERHVGYFSMQETGQCTEIIEYTSPDEISVCTLASLALPRFVGFDQASNRMFFSFAELHAATMRATRNLNRVIDINTYLFPSMVRSNLRHRPVGLGVQGLADTFCLLQMPFDSAEARELNRQIFETIYHAALTASCALAERDGVYETYAGSPVSRGILQPDMWNVRTTDSLWNWTELRARIQAHGVRNSLLVAPMPTASTAQILGNNTSFEPFASNIFVRAVLSGYFTVVNRHLVQKLHSLGLWSREMYDRIVAADGSVQAIDEIPADVRAVYRTVWEIPQRTLIDMSAERGAFIDQSQSFNVFLKSPTLAVIGAVHMHAWRQGLKTGQYYLRIKEAAKAATVGGSGLSRAAEPARSLETPAVADAAAPATTDSNATVFAAAAASAAAAAAAAAATACRRDNRGACAMCEA